eukprot:1461018-Amphidinium_carterae.1
MFSDNLAVVLAHWKGRIPGRCCDWKLLNIIRSWTAISAMSQPMCLATTIDCIVRWMPSEENVAAQPPRA